MRMKNNNTYIKDHIIYDTWEDIEMTQTNTSVKATFKGDHVGSYMRPERSKQARIQKENGEITGKQLRNIEDTEIIKLVEKQKEAGLKSITDGEYRRAWWHFDFLENLVGVE